MYRSIGSVADITVIRVRLKMMKCCCSGQLCIVTLFAAQFGVRLFLNAVRSPGYNFSSIDDEIFTLVAPPGKFILN